MVILLNLITCRFFWIVWAFVQARWAKKLDPDNKSDLFIGAYVACIIVGNIVGDMLSNYDTTVPFGTLLNLIGVICFLVGVFKIRASMEEYYTSTENISLQLSGVMTFFFGVIYFQYHINRIARWKKTGVLT